MHAIDISNLSFTYENRTTYALDHVNLSVGDREFVLVAGASGSGKSTLLKCVNGLIPHRYVGEYTGQVTLRDRPVIGTSLQELSLIVGTVLQEPDKQLVSSSGFVKLKPADYVSIFVIGLCLAFAVYLRTRFTTYWIPA